MFDYNLKIGKCKTLHGLLDSTARTIVLWRGNISLRFYFLDYRTITRL